MVGGAETRTREQWIGENGADNKKRGTKQRKRHVQEETKQMDI